MADHLVSSRMAAGAMTGTSIDGIDVALVHIEGTGLSIRATLVRHASASLGALREPLRRLAAQTPIAAGELAGLAAALGTLHADILERLVTPGALPDLIVVHGQTVFHAPPSSWQLIDPSPIVERLGVPVVTDLRSADLAAGGRGAPITPLADWILLRDAHTRRAVVNLGGFANLTVLPASVASTAVEEITGEDVCACNHVLDEVARSVLRAPLDKDGRAALAGRPDVDRAAELQRTLAAAAGATRSLGTGDEAWGWIARHRDAIAPNDLAATAVTAIARHLSGRLQSTGAAQIILAGGGARNRALVGAIAQRANAEVTTTDVFGIPVEAREAMAMAILGVLCADGVPITLPQVTGCHRPAPVAGRWSFGRSCVGAGCRRPV